MRRRGRVAKTKQPAVMTAGAGGESFGQVDDHPLGASGSGNSAQTELDSELTSRDEVDLVRRATEVLGPNYVARWMQSKIPSLGNQSPYVLIQTEDGRRQIERVLLKIEHGVY